MTNLQVEKAQQNELIKQEIENKFKTRQRTLILPEDGQPCSQPQSKRASLHDICVTSIQENKKAETMHATPRDTIELDQEKPVVL